MESVEWSQAWLVVARGLGLVFAIMCLLAVVTWILGRVFQGIEAKKKAAAKAKAESKAGKGQP
ncbi:MAG: OadG family protein [Deltaproteobacteria bacterium]|nr:OadG family protein [Deltaproteobacteria bacterium]